MEHCQFGELEKVAEVISIQILEAFRPESLQVFCTYRRVIEHRAELKYRSAGGRWMWLKGFLFYGALIKVSLASSIMKKFLGIKRIIKDLWRRNPFLRKPLLLMERLGAIAGFATN